MEEGGRNSRWPQRQRGHQIPAEVHNERVHASRISRAGYLGAVTRVRGQIETLITNPTNAEIIRTLTQHYEDSWCKFIEAHNHFMSIIGSDSSEFYHTLQQFDQLHLGKLAFIQQFLSIYMKQEPIVSN